MITTAEEGLLARQTIERYGEWGDSPTRFFYPLALLTHVGSFCENQCVQQNESLYKMFAVNATATNLSYSIFIFKRVKRPKSATGPAVNLNGFTKWVLYGD